MKIKLIFQEDGVIQSVWFRTPEMATSFITNHLYHQIKQEYKERYSGPMVIEMDLKIFTPEEENND